MATVSGSGLGDKGNADPVLSAELAEYEKRGGGEGPVIAALAVARLLAPIVTTLAEEATTDAGLRHDKRADVAVPLLQRPDGRRAMLAFTGVESMALWDADARPRPAMLADIVAMAQEQGADAVVVDVSGPVPFVIEGSSLRHLAAGHSAMPTTSGLVWLETKLPF